MTASILSGILVSQSTFAQSKKLVRNIKSMTITIRALHRAYHNTPITFALPPEQIPQLKSASHLFLESADHKEKLPAQLVQTGTEPQLTVLLEDLPQGASRTYHLRDIPDGHPTSNHPASNHPASMGVYVHPHGDDLDVLIGADSEQNLFTRYTTKTGPNKPFFYPILTPEGAPMTRRWPMEQNSTESHDHPHHRGLWFTHSKVNGIDFWSEEGRYGKTINTGFENLTSGRVVGGFRALTEWRTPDDKLIAHDIRNIRFYPLANGDRLMDFEITLTPTDGPLVFGDNKDGMFGLRLPDSLAPNPEKSAHVDKPTGHILTSTGAKDGAAWGKPAEWVDYWGPIQGKTYGVAIFDATTNLRHPETWHARDYGLFTANPFGLHDFNLGDKGAGDYTVPANGKFVFRYRLLFHRGDTAAADVAGQYAAWIDPPEVTIK